MSKPTLDEVWAAACDGDTQAFANWMGRVERPIRSGLWNYARAVDVESVVQETLLRMWQKSQDDGRDLTGESGSLRFAKGVARNVARSEARKYGRESLLPADDDLIPDPDPDPPGDPFLEKLIRKCIDKLPDRSRAALNARIDQGHSFKDAALAALLKMTHNTFRQNFSRALKHLAACLEKGGASLKEILR